jgi:Flp pilus assembly protein TadG
MTRRLVRDERGVAALEMALFSTILLLIGFGALPLYASLRASQKVSKTSAATLRYATSVASNGRRATDGTLSRRPTFTEIQTFARDAAHDPGLDVVVTVCRAGTCTTVDDASPAKTAPIPAVAGDTVRLTVSSTVDMSLFGRLANAVTGLTGDPVFPENEKTVSATASAREE